MQELIFWIIFLTVSISLLISQSLVKVEKPVVPVPQGTLIETLPDPKKEDPALVLEYESVIVRERLAELDRNTSLVYGLGKSSGPDLNVPLIKESSRQLALQQIISKLETKKSIIKEFLRKGIPDQDYLAELESLTEKAFWQLYSVIAFEEGTLISTFRIWTKTEKQIVTYYSLIVFNHDYALSYVLSLYPELAVIAYSGKQMSFETLWLAAFRTEQ
ncbi:hypothetical protein [Fervidobacterium thailandense]|uniref:Uncharacterized protein n=1 Tax=Fervidobacterium thailandense TaxID=1008305 RepID=A0A1E3G1Z9_9BACT|nr:hypothetical protein [Fervidobacterium thailandense]ODN30287.1 hypothetical protein A4H02_06265 [Fervidobacterium thailandense]